jgi:sensor histidine kinase YesM
MHAGSSLMPSILILVNSLVQDTCVVIVIAYLLGRGSILTSLDRAGVSRRDAVRLGAVLGIVGLLEIVFPGARYPYKIDMLVSVYAAAVGGLAAGLPCTAIVSLGSLALQPRIVAFETAGLLVASVVLTSAVRKPAAFLGETVGRVVLGSMAQAIAVSLEGLLALHWNIRYSPVGDVWSIPANAFGLTIFQVFVNFALERRRNEELKLDVERSKAMATQARLAALRARIHPHFLYNALTSIAGLCRIAPEKAERAIVSLGALMRNTLESSVLTSIPLAQELGGVRLYLEIEQNRLGDRLRVDWDVEGADPSTPVPPFALQTMVENAIKHGIAPKVEPSTLSITAHDRGGKTVICVADDGLGIVAEDRDKIFTGENDEVQHGLQLLNRQLELQHGPRARVRLFSKIDRGTLVVFAVPCRPEGDK